MVTTQEERIGDLRARDEWRLGIFDALRDGRFDHYVEITDVKEVTSPATRGSGWMEQGWSRIWSGEHDACYVLRTPLTRNHDHAICNGDAHCSEMGKVWRGNWLNDRCTVPPEPITYSKWNSHRSRQDSSDSHPGKITTIRPAMVVCSSTHNGQKYGQQTMEPSCDMCRHGQSISTEGVFADQQAKHLRRRCNQ